MAKGLKVDIRGDATHFERTMRGIRGSLSTLGPAMLNIAKATAAVGAAAAAAATAFAAWKIKEVLDLGGKMSDLSARTGVAAGELKVLDEALRLAGVESADTGKILQTLGKNIALSIGDESGEAALNLQWLGLEAEDLVNMPLDRAFEKVGKAIAGFTKESDRARAAQALFSKAGMPMVALFKDFDRTMTTARGNVGGLAGILNQFADRFDAVSDAIGGMNLKFQQFFAGLTSEILPQLEALVNKAGEFDFTLIGQKIGKALADAVQGQSEGLKAIGGVIGAYIQAGLEATAGIMVATLLQRVGGAVADFNSKYLFWNPGSAALSEPMSSFAGRMPSATQIGSSSVSDANPTIRAALERLYDVMGRVEINTRAKTQGSIIQN